MTTSTPFQLRKRLQEITDQATPFPFKGKITTDNIALDQINGFKARTYLPNAINKQTTLIFFHGGGFVAGSIESHDNFCRMFSQKLGCKLISLEYPLAPEYKSDVIVSACYQALCALSKHENSIALIGDSAGANLATVCACLAKENAHPEVKMQILIDPLVDMVSPGKYQACRDVYLPDLTDLHNPLISPVYAVLNGMPASIIILNEEDSLFQQGQTYVEKLQAAQVQVISKTFTGGHLGSHLVCLDEQSQKPIAWLIQVLQDEIS
ncbi:alpha/beta hydrolase fold domain-containing protein [Facilibium subflavum]|uniref:alpha/beta hydrolase fold domain-containing protein n=1 Tax=Facilibium subflavum TaxID=2219058 RepID=UPI0013C2E671|nr:alpha/beta hydrolase fold domain-containing protein [Facilibium subflavum]